MSGAATALSRRLGGPGTRRRRHRRFALLAAVLLLIALGLILLGGRADDDDFEEGATALCVQYAQRVLDEVDLSFPEGPPSDEAFAEYLSHAFADTMEELFDELDALEPPADVAAIIDGYRAVVADIRTRPEDFLTQDSPFAELARQFDAAGLPECGSDFEAIAFPE